MCKKCKKFIAGNECNSVAEIVIFNGMLSCIKRKTGRLCPLCLTFTCHVWEIWQEARTAVPRPWSLLRRVSVGIRCKVDVLAGFVNVTTE